MANVVYATVSEKVDLPVGASESFTMVAPEPTDFFQGWVRWGKPAQFDPAKDCAVEVSGGEFLSSPVVFNDGGKATKQTFNMGPQPAGTYVVTVRNVGTVDLVNVAVEAAMGRFGA